VALERTLVEARAGTSEVEVWNNRDTFSGGYKRNQKRERAATAKEYLALRAATNEKHETNALIETLTQKSLIQVQPYAKNL
jgi:hypothetical protein